MKKNRRILTLSIDTFLKLPLELEKLSFLSNCQL